MVPRSELQHAAISSFGSKLQCLRVRVRQIARERDQARLDLEKVERHCLQLGRQLDEQGIALEHTQSKLKDVQAEIEAKELFLQQSVNHQAKLEADTQFLKGTEASLQGRLNHMMKENTQLQNKVMEMAQRLATSEKLVSELQKDLNRTVNDKVLWDQNGVLRRELERLCLHLQESRAERGLPAQDQSSQGTSLAVCHSSSSLVPNSACTGTSLSMEQHQEQLQDLKVQLKTKSEKSKGEVSSLRVKTPQLGCELSEHKDGCGAGHGPVLLRSQQLAGSEWPPRTGTAARLEHHQQHVACWMEIELLQQHLKASQEQLLEAKASLSLAQTRHALQLQQAKAQMNDMVPKKQFEQLQISLREEQCKAQQLQEDLHRQAEQTCRQLVRTQEEHKCLLQTAVEQAEGLEHNLRSAEAVLAERVAQLRDAQAQLSRNKLLIEELREENRGFAMALQAAELKQKSTEEKNQLLEEQASALKQLITKITPVSLSG
ncbi:ninein-like protein isoform 2-T3 [Porphyrio hochstetteri]